jgi:hypothetical protein
MKEEFMKKSLIFVLISGFLICFQFPEVINKDKPLNGEWDFHPQLTWEVEEAGQDLFGEIQNLAINSAQKVFVADLKHSYIFVFDRNGRYLKRFGKKGEGPGEIREYYGGDQLHIVGDKVLFTDRALVHYFDYDGNYLKTVPFSPILRPRAFIDEHTFISAPATNDRRSREPAKITVYDLDTKKRSTIASFSPFEKATSTEQTSSRQVTVGIVINDITPLMMVHFADDLIYYGMSDTYRLYISDLQGKIISSFSVPGRKANPVSNEYKKELKASLGDVPENFLNSIIDGLPAHASFFSAIHVDEGGNIYLFESDPDSKSKKCIDIFNPKGEFVYRGFFEAKKGESIESILIGDGLALVVIEDEDGTIRLSRYSIKLPL